MDRGRIVPEVAVAADDEDGGVCRAADGEAVLTPARGDWGCAAEDPEAGRVELAAGVIPPGTEDVAAATRVLVTGVEVDSEVAKPLVDEPDETSLSVVRSTILPESGGSAFSVRERPALSRLAWNEKAAPVRVCAAISMKGVDRPGETPVSSEATETRPSRSAVSGRKRRDLRRRGVMNALVALGLPIRC